MPRTVDLFAGCGGLSLGFAQAGFEIVAAYDNSGSLELTDSVTYRLTDSVSRLSLLRPVRLLVSMLPVDKPLFLTPEELAEVLRVSPETVRRWLRTGEVKGHRAGRLWRVPWEEGVRLLGGEDRLEEALKEVRG